MTKIAIVPNAAGTGTFTIEAPNSNSNRTLVLPDAAGELLTDVSSLPAANLTGDVAAARITTALNATGSAPIYACRAWVSFNGTNGAIAASGNVSSVSRTGTGTYTINFAQAMPDANYAMGNIALRMGDGTSWLGLCVGPSGLSTTQAFLEGHNQVGTAQDSTISTVAFFR
jgi:hypothetical protein